MPERPSTFRDFGILPAGIQPPNGKVRAFYSTARVVGQYIGTAIMTSLGLGLAIIFALTLPLPMGVLGAAASLAVFGVIVFLATRRDYRWVELDGETIRAGHLYSGRILERSIVDISSLGTMVYQVSRLQTHVVEHLLGRVRGIEIRFTDGSTLLRVMRADPAMTHAGELMEAIVYRMSQLRELDADIIDFRGRPLVRSIYWKGDGRPAPRSNNGTLIAGCLMFMALLFGGIVALIGAQKNTLHVLGSMPPQVMSVASLIQNGPGANRHLTLTDFRPGGYALEGNDGRWKSVWIALFPADSPTNSRDEIKVVLLTHDVHDSASLLRFVNSGRISGICSAAPQTGFGSSVGPQLVSANEGRPLNTAWSIEELIEVPTAADVRSVFAMSAACLGTALILALGILGFQLKKKPTA